MLTKKNEAPNSQVIGAFEFLQQWQPLNQVKVATCPSWGFSVVRRFLRTRGYLRRFPIGDPQVTMGFNARSNLDDLRIPPWIGNTKVETWNVWCQPWMNHLQQTTGTTQMFNGPFLFFSGEDLFSSWSPEKRGELKPMDNDHTNKKTHSEEAQYNRHSVETNDGCWLYFTSWKHWSSCVIFCCFRFLLRLYISKIVLVPFMFSPSTRQPHISN